jgi:hypothetical protein
MKKGKKTSWHLSNRRLKEIMKEQTSVLPNAIKEYNTFVKKLEKTAVGKFFKEGNKLYFIAKKNEESNTFSGITLTNNEACFIPNVTVGYIRPKNSCWVETTKKEFFKLLDGLSFLNRSFMDNTDTLQTRMFINNQQYIYNYSTDPHSLDKVVSIKPSTSFEEQDHFFNPESAREINKSIKGTNKSTPKKFGVHFDLIPLRKNRFGLFSIPDLTCWFEASFIHRRSVSLTAFNKAIKPLFRIKSFVNKTIEETNGKK